MNIKLFLAITATTAGVAMITPVITEKLVQLSTENEKDESIANIRESEIRIGVPLVTYGSIVLVGYIVSTQYNILHNQNKILHNQKVIYDFLLKTTNIPKISPIPIDTNKTTCCLIKN